MTTPTSERPTAPPEFNPTGMAALRDPASMYVQARKDNPVFWSPELHTWIVTRREDVDAVLMDWESFSCLGNGGNIPVPDKFAEIVPSSLMSKIMISMDPPEHTEARRVAQRGFLKPVIDALVPEIEARAHRIIDRFADAGAVDLMDEYCLELTTQTLMALLGLPDEDERMMRTLRDDHFAILASGREPMEEPRCTQVWDRYTRAQLRLRALVEERREGSGNDIITTMATARNREGGPALSAERIAMHLTEFSAAGTDTTAQAIANAILFLSAAPEQLAQAQADASLWSRVIEETVRRRPSAPFASRQAARDVEISGVAVTKGDMLWLALASANTDPTHYADPEKWDIHRENPEDHYAFTKGRHACLGQPLGRAQGAAALRVLFTRLPSLRAVPDAPQEFLPLAMLPIRRNLAVAWNRDDALAGQTS
ncbi:cytochrome P450 [Cryobacterium sp. N19]|uniref:cytochrome P450 n=1 Tax=Cryobacterium sp. N19 TaxID=2048288 RepID=UPI000CE5357D|nr:cytochrome P450 [Cryobacterium sp. N19]